MVVWTIWESRNAKTFRDSETTLSQAKDMVRFRVAWWFKNLGKGSSDPITTLFWNINDGCYDPIPSKKAKVMEWAPPPLGSYKFNVDG